MEKLDLGVNIVYMGLVVWDSNILVSMLLIVARCLVHICLTGLLLSLLQEVLVLLFRLPGL